MSFLEIDEICKLTLVSWYFKEIGESQAVWLDLGIKFNARGLELVDLKNKVKNSAFIAAQTYSFFLAQFPELKKKNSIYEKHAQITAHLNSFYKPDQKYVKDSSKDLISCYLKETNAMALEYYPKTKRHEMR